MTQPNKWFVAPQIKPEADTRIFLFPYAGGGPSVFSNWSIELSNNLETQIAHYPGRGSRYNESPIKSLTTLIKELTQAIQPLLDKPFLFFGHSLGGVIVVQALPGYTSATPLEANVVAAPLAGMPLLEKACAFRGVTPGPWPGAVTLTQWRTRKNLDGAFRSLAADPQDVALPAVKVVRLPESYRGHRLGHNWSVSWVADELAATR